jgi:hypothetical protein
MDTFTDVYSSLISQLQTKSLDSSWSELEGELKALCQEGGPDAGKAACLKKLREKIDTFSGIQNLLNPAKVHADVILKASKSPGAGFQKRAAMLKTFKHFYLHIKKGNQNIWIVDHPKDYGKWAFDELEGKPAKDVDALLQSEPEAFGSSRRRMMSDSLQLARKWVMDIVVKLSNADADTLAVVKRWFHNDADSEALVKATALVLKEGFKKIENVCNSTTVIFSDRPHKRADASWNEGTFASVRSDDTMPVIYIFQAFLNAGKRTFFGNIPKLWLCALTVVHELSHKMVQTEDISYDYQGLKPGGASVTAADAIKNADSWAYFGADLVGVLSQATKKDVLK